MRKIVILLQASGQKMNTINRLTQNLCSETDYFVTYHSNRNYGSLPILNYWAHDA